MTPRPRPRVLTISPGAPFLPTLAAAIRDGRLIPGFTAGDDPMALAGATIFVPTRRAARELRAVLAATSPVRSAILPTIKALGEFDEGEAAFSATGADMLAATPPVSSIDRLLLLAPLVQKWKENLPDRLAEMFDEPVIVPASTSDSIWLARDLAALMDEVELEGTSWEKLRALITDDLSSWWQVTFDFLNIVTKAWPAILQQYGLANPAAHRDALLRAEALRLVRNPPAGPVIAAGSTGSIPATAELLKAIASLPNGAVVLPGLDLTMDDATWGQISALPPEPTVYGHPQYGMARLLSRLAIGREEVADLQPPDEVMAHRAWIVSEALRPAESTDSWILSRGQMTDADMAVALANVELIEAGNERDEAAAIAVALRHAIEAPGRTAALVTPDRKLARRVATELLRFGIVADDSGGTPLANTLPATLLRLIVHSVFEPGDPVAIVSLLKHPLLRLGRTRERARRLTEVAELVALRGGTGRPDIATIQLACRERLDGLQKAKARGGRTPHWLGRLSRDTDDALLLLTDLALSVSPLAALRDAPEISLGEAVRATVQALEAIGKDDAGTVAGLYDRDAGTRLIAFLRELSDATVDFRLAPAEWPSVLTALMGAETVKPTTASDPRVSIWGALEARLQSVDTLILGGLNEGSWPRKPQTDRLMSRIMKTGIDLEPPERRIGQAAHDFQMGMGAPHVILTRAARDGDSPTVPSRWLQRIKAFVGDEQNNAMRRRGDAYVVAGRKRDQLPVVAFARRAEHNPPLEFRPKSFSVTEIEKLRRDPYAVYARRVLRLRPIEPLLRDPSAAERGTLFHEILNRFSREELDPDRDKALQRLLQLGRDCFDEEALPEDVEAVWWPRFRRMAREIVDWEMERAPRIISRHPEIRALPTPIGRTGVTLHGEADRVDILARRRADIIDYKTGSNPSKVQAHTLVSPQLALEAALLERGAFEGLPALKPGDLAYIRLRPNGRVEHESILKHRKSEKTAADMGEDAWERLQKLVKYYRDPNVGYVSRVMPFKERDTGGDYDHLARVLEWSAGGASEDESAE